jgi:hypothetical protein
VILINFCVFLIKRREVYVHWHIIVSFYQLVGKSYFVHEILVFSLSISFLYERYQLFYLFIFSLSSRSQSEGAGVWFILFLRCIVSVFLLTEGDDRLVRYSSSYKQELT